MAAVPVLAVAVVAVLLGLVAASWYWTR